jgi:hypothetical protein
MIAWPGGSPEPQCYTQNELETREFVQAPEPVETGPGDLPRRLREVLETESGWLRQEFVARCAPQLAALAADAEAAGRAETERQARARLTSELAQSVRRLRQAGTPEEIAFWLVDAAASVCPRVALLSVVDTVVQGVRLRGVDADAAQAAFESLDLVLPEAPALAQCASSREMLAAIATPHEVSPQLAGVFSHFPGEKVYLFPVVVRGDTAAILYAAPGAAAADTEALELFVQAAGMATEALLGRPAAAPAIDQEEAGAGLIQIAGAARPAAESRSLANLNWQELSEEDQQLHLGARRFARVKVAEIRLYHADAVEQGRRRRNLYGVLKESMDEAREAFRQKFVSASETMIDYLHLEFMKSLAHDNPALLGTGYPGPLV